jgi:hypothetical protein
MQTKTTTKSAALLSEDQWNLPEGVEKFSEGHVYFAKRVGYHQGFAEGVEQEKKEIDNRIQNNLIVAGVDTSKLVNAMREIGITPISANLKVVSESSLRVLVTVSDEDFLKEDFLRIYSIAREIQDNSKTEVYSIYFSFVNRSPSFDAELVELDGFTYSYKPLTK